MFVGHYAVGLAMKRAAPSASLGTHFLAVQLLDLVWPVFLLLGLEQVRYAPGVTAAQPFVFVHYPYSHSLLAAAGWSVLMGAGYYLVRRNGRVAAVLALGVLSHWVLDAIVHRPDLPVFPCGPKVGLGLWNSVPATLAVEGLVYAVGITLYLRTTKPKDRLGAWSLWVMLLLLFVSWLQGVLAAPTADQTAVAVGALVLWIMIPWAAWADRHRRVVLSDPDN